MGRAWDNQVEPHATSGYTRRMPNSPQISFIGAGNMSEALVSGILKSGLADSSSLRVTDVSPSRLQHFQKSFSVQSASDNVAAVQWSDVVLLCVKPQIMDQVLEEIQSKIEPRHLLISVAAGYPIKRIQDRAGKEASIIRAMPNTPAVIQEGVTAIAASPFLDSTQVRLGHRIFESIGKVVLVDECLMDAVTGLSGSGPAYVYLFIEALTDAGVQMGIPRESAKVLATHTVLGAAKMVEETGEHPATLKDRVTSPGGTTISGLRELESGRLRATVMKAVEAATKRSLELGKYP